MTELYGTSTRKVAKVAAKMGIERLSKDQVIAIAASLDAEAEELLCRDLRDVRMPYLWLDATYVKCRAEGHVASTAVVSPRPAATTGAGARSSVGDGRIIAPLFQGQGRQRRARYVPRRHRHAWGLLPKGRGDLRRRRGRTRRRTPTSRSPTGSGCVPTTCRSAPTSR